MALLFVSLGRQSCHTLVTDHARLLHATVLLLNRVGQENHGCEIIESNCLHGAQRSLLEQPRGHGAEGAGALIVPS